MLSSQNVDAETDVSEEEKIIDGDALLADVRRTFRDETIRARAVTEERRASEIRRLQEWEEQKIEREEMNRLAAERWREAQTEQAAKLAVETERRREIARKAEEKRANAPRACQLFADPRMRLRWLLDRASDGLTGRAIAGQLGISPARTNQLMHRAERLMKERRIHPRAHLSEPIDPGGPRDVWLEFHPPPDPRFDNMAPVTLDSFANIAA